MDILILDEGYWEVRWLRLGVKNKRHLYKINLF